jgi:AraC-like DNA-binding protein
MRYGLAPSRRPWPSRSRCPGQRICGLAAGQAGAGPGAARVREAVRLIRASRGRVAVRWLAGQVNLNISQLERSFTRQVGVGPKLLARQTRLCALAAGAMELAGPAWALLAANYGYADQAYLAPEFRELTGLTPSRLAWAGCGQTGAGDQHRKPSPRKTPSRSGATAAGAAWSLISRPRGEPAMGRGSRELLGDLGPSVLSDELGQRTPNSRRPANELVRGRGISGGILDPVPSGAEGLPATETSVYVVGNQGPLDTT